MTDTAQEIQTYDFRQPGGIPGQVQKFFAAWQEAIAGAIPEAWQEHLPFDVAWSVRPAKMVRPPDALAQMPDPAVAYRLVTSEHVSDMLLVFPRPLSVALVDGMLGAPGDELPEDRELTSVEQAVNELAVLNVLEVMNNSQPGPEPVTFELGGRVDDVRHMSLFDAGDSEVLVCQFEIEGPFGAQPCFWVLAESLVDLFADKLSARQPAEPGIKAVLEQLMQEVPLQVVVRLGGARMDVSDLARLRVGDLLMLDQRVSDPLVAVVQDHTEISGWAGRMGARQAFQVESIDSS